jgi:hypothetical protein
MDRKTATHGGSLFPSKVELSTQINDLRGRLAFAAERATHLEAEVERMRRGVLGLCKQWEAFAALSDRATGSWVGALHVEVNIGALQAEANTWRSCAAVLRAVVEESSDG